MTLASLVEFLTTRWNYLIYIGRMMIGLYAVLAKGNLVKKVIGLNILQTAVFLFYLSIGKSDGATVPVTGEGFSHYENPVPHVLMLTAIVVGVSVTAVALALIVRIKKAYGTVEELEVLDIDQRETAAAEAPPDEGGTA